MAEEDDGEKEHEPSQKRLDDARARGEVPQSPDLVGAAAYGGFVLACVTSGPQALQAVGEVGGILLGQADRMAALLSAGAAAPIMGILLRVGGAVAPFFLLPAVAAVVALIAMRAVAISPSKLAPRLSRISPIQNFGHKFGREGLFEFAKSTVKLVVIAVVLGVFLMQRFAEILPTLELGAGLVMVVLLRLTVAFLGIVLAIAVALGAIDFVWQRAQFIRRNRMSRQEVMDEFRQSEGDPHLKAQRRQRGQAIATNRMLLDVPRADVVIVNPTHYAVALRWNKAAGSAPVCVAKGVDEVAAIIRGRAALAGVPIHSDPPTARALFGTVEIGEEIRPEHYRAVAASIRFADAMRKKARAR
jgi:flagellar biosynthesis protein FlhB